jgi:hypothetical protein
MGSLLVNEIYKVQLVCTFGEQTSINRSWWQVKSVTGLLPSDQNFADRLAGTLALDFKLALSASATYRGVSVQKVYPLPAYDFVTSLINQGPGGTPLNPLPRQVSGFIQLLTGFAGKRYKGRMYMPFPAAGSSGTDAHPTAPYLAALAAIANWFCTDLTVTAGIETAVLRAGLWHQTQPSLIPFIDNVENPEWATQRRRGDKGRPNSPPF